MYTDEQDFYKNNCQYDKKKLTCSNLPLATAYVRSQPYQNLNSPFETLKQGTFFADLYDRYIPSRVAKGGRPYYE
ncbi:MAG: spore coat associated protein CotJA [Turicibacter sp.]|nr:spore coat associated protein CotJA [Turicibacter sp.]